MDHRAYVLCLLRLASRALIRADPKETKIMDANMPIIVTTTNSSISVNPLPFKDLSFTLVLMIYSLINFIIPHP